MVFKEPRNDYEANQIVGRANDLVQAARALEHCKVEPETSAKLRRIARQMMDAVLGTTD